MSGTILLFLLASFVMTNSYTTLSENQQSDKQITITLTKEEHKLLMENLEKLKKIEQIEKMERVDNKNILLYLSMVYLIVVMYSMIMAVFAVNGRNTNLLSMWIIILLSIMCLELFFPNILRAIVIIKCYGIFTGSMMTIISMSMALITKNKIFIEYTIFNMWVFVPLFIDIGLQPRKIFGEFGYIVNGLIILLLSLASYYVICNI